MGAFMSAAEVLAFWFDDLTEEQWWRKDPVLDGLIQTRFGALHARAAEGALWQWRETAEGRLAEIIVLDQFSRNIYRDQARSFAQDPMALVLCQEATRAGCHQQMDNNQLGFLWMPMMHSESPAIHQEAVRLMNRPGLERTYQFEIQHKEIIDRFGRYPHRNAILGRVSSPEEEAFLKQPGSSF